MGGFRYSSSPLKSPCTKECPRRTATCKPTCPEHIKYEKLKAKERAERQKIYETNDIVLGYSKDVTRKLKKYRKNN